MSWGTRDDVVSLGPLRVAVQRIALAHWRAPGRLRSWGIAPLHREADSLLIPCAHTEALWIGAWIEDADTTARILLHDRRSDRAGALSLPDGYQLTALARPGGPAEPISAGPDTEEPAFDLTLEVDAERAALTLVFLAPVEWARRSGRQPPAPLDRPPPLPPRLP